MKGVPGKPRSPEQYDEEYQALQASLEDYLRRQVEMLAKSGQAAGTAVARESAWRRYRADVYFAVTLILVGLLAWRILWPPAPSPASPAPTSARPSSSAGSSTPPPPPPPNPAPTPSSSASQTPAGFDAPSTFWIAYVEANRGTVADWLVAVSEARGLASGAVSDLQKGNFKRWSEKVRSGTETGADRNLCRTGLFEYVYGLWAKSKGGAAASAWGRVDLLVSQDEYPTEQVRALLAELGVDSWFNAVDRKDPKVHSAVILAWLANHQP